MDESIKNFRRQTIISYLIIIVLILVAVVIGIKQWSYEKSIPEDTILASNLFGAGFSPVGDVELYNADNLYEKIDGKADLYLNNGFVSLQSRRFVNKSDKEKWAEIYLYDMASGENAFAVYSGQKRSESSPLDWTQFGYSTSDSIYLTAGRYYIELFLSSDDKQLMTSAQTAVKNLVSILSVDKTEIPVINLFPANNLVADSFKFIKSDAFGSELENIFTTQYTINGNNITAYLSKNNPAEMYKKYYRFLIDNGANELQLNINLPACKAVELYGTNEIFFVSGNYFGGVRGSAPIEDLQKLAKKLIEKIK